MATQEIPHETIQRILELYLCSDDPRIKHISSLLNVPESDVLTIVKAYTDEQLPFLRGNYVVLNSEINYQNE